METVYLIYFNGYSESNDDKTYISFYGGLDNFSCV